MNHPHPDANCRFASAPLSIRHHRPWVDGPPTDHDPGVRGGGGPNAEPVGHQRVRPVRGRLTRCSWLGPSRSSRRPRPASVAGVGKPGRWQPATCPTPTTGC